MHCHLHRNALSLSMLKKGLLAICLVLICSVGFAQSKKKPTSKKLTSAESATLTPEQRLVHETNRKSKKGKNDMAVKKKIRIAQKQDRKSRKAKAPKSPKRKN